MTSAREAGEPSRLHRRDRLRETARHDVAEIIQIRIDVQCKSMRRDPPADMHADRGNLALLRPDSGGSLDAPRLDPELASASINTCSMPRTYATTSRFHSRKSKIG